MTAELLALLAAASATTAFTDPRDGETYRIAELGGLLWMAENLRHAVPGSTCYDYRPDNCWLLGRLYTLDEARAACPPGWRLPSDEDWMTLERAVGVPESELANERARGSVEQSGDRLKADGGSGFDGLLAGYSDPHRGGQFRRRGEAGAYWASTLAGADDVSPVAWHRDLNAARTGIYRSKVNVTYRLSVRCVAEPLG